MINLKNSKTLCVILHYGSEYYTNQCIGSLLKIKNIDIIISDNDPSQLYKPPKNIIRLVKIIKTGGDLGFSEGNNLAVKKFLTRDHGSVLILSNDTIVQEGAVDYLRNTLNSSGVGIVGPCMPYAKDKKKIWACGGYINKIKLTMSGLQQKKNQPYEVDYIPGAAFICRADLWREIGGFNQEYYLTYEEAEFSLEIKKRRFKVLVDPRSIVLHHVGMSAQLLSKYYYNRIRNRLIFSRYLYGKNIGLIYGLLITFLASFRAYSSKKIFYRIKLWI